jgi:hypothetical protein
MLLPVLYWVILVLAIIGVFVPIDKYPHARYLNGIVVIVLFVIIGLRSFRMAVT